MCPIKWFVADWRIIDALDWLLETAWQLSPGDPQLPLGLRRLFARRILHYCEARVGAISTACGNQNLDSIMIFTPHLEPKADYV